MTAAKKAPAKRKAEPVIAELRQRFAYDPATGALRYLISPMYRVKAGALAGSLNDKGYLTVTFLRQCLAVHRICWALEHGYWPTEIDHINGDRADNRMANLRECSRAENMQNKRRYASNTSGHPGVSWFRPDRRWVARISVHGRRFFLGSYRTKAEAVAAREAGKARLHSFHPIERSA